MSTVDPGTEEAVSHGAQEIEPGSGDGKKDDHDDSDDFTDPSRWWFMSTACPLIAGTFGPMASGFSICALVQKWRVYIPPEGSEEHGVKIPDPKWLVAVNAISLVAALVGNASLLLNMARRLRFSIAQPITISGFLLAGVLLVADMAALTSSSTYFITEPRAEPSVNHALTSAFYYAIFAAAIYIFISFLMCLTVYGASRRHYKKDFYLTPSQRTLMLQTMSFIAYILLGALVYSKIEGWEYLNAVYFADVTLLTVGFGDFSPMTQVGRGLLFPFAIGGILMVGLVVGSIRSLVLERGKEKLGARMVEKRRSNAIHNVDGHRQTIRISWFAKAEFSVDPSLSPAQRREEEFEVMRKVLRVAETERRWMALATSATFALGLWFVGAAIFMRCEYTQQWTYFEALYFSFVALLTIGYGDFVLLSNSGRAFFVVWSLLAVPSLTILISNMGDTVVKWFSDLTVWIGSLTVLPGDQGFRANFRNAFQQSSRTAQIAISKFTPAGILGDLPQPESRPNSEEHQQKMMAHVAERLSGLLEQEELDEMRRAEKEGDEVERDTHFYNYVLARECCNVQRDLNTNPKKQYTWHEWEYYLRLVGNEDDSPEQPLGQHASDALVPDELRVAPRNGSDDTMTTNLDVSQRSAPTEDNQLSGSVPDIVDGVVDRETERRERDSAHEKKRPSATTKRGSTTSSLQDWSWLSAKSPLMGPGSESEWILERLAAALAREMNRSRKGHRRQPPVCAKDMMGHVGMKE